MDPPQKASVRVPAANPADYTCSTMNAHSKSLPLWAATMPILLLKIFNMVSEILDIGDDMAILPNLASAVQLKLP